MFFMDASGDEIERRFTGTVRRIRKVEKGPDTGRVGWDGDKFPGLTFQKKRIKGLKQNDGAESVDFVVFQYDVDFNFRSSLPIVGDPRVCNDDVKAPVVWSTTLAAASASEMLDERIWMTWTFGFSTANLLRASDLEGSRTPAKTM
jgi:hypothetical protein